MKKQITVMELSALGVGQQFYDEITDTTPYTVKKIEYGRVYSNSLVDKDRCIMVPPDHIVYIES